MPWQKNDVSPASETMCKATLTQLNGKLPTQTTLSACCTYNVKGKGRLSMAVRKTPHRYGNSHLLLSSGNNIKYIKQGPDLQNILRFIIRLSSSLSQDRLTIVTFNELRFLLGISYANTQTLSPTILRFCKKILPKKSNAFFVRCLVN